MAQHDLNIANADGATVRADLNGALAALGTTMKGPSTPPAAQAGLLWINDSSSPWILCVYDGVDWINIGTINPTTNAFSVAGIGTIALLNSIAISNLDNSAKPYSLPFALGFGWNYLGEDLVADLAYGVVQLDRDITFDGEVGYLQTAGTGADVIIDVERSQAGGTWTSIFSTKPKFAAGSNTITTAGVLGAGNTNVNATDRFRVKCVQKGSTIAGQMLTYTLKGRLR